MRLVSTAKAWFAALAVTVVAAVPLYASIPRGCAGIGGQRPETGVSGRLVCTVRLSGRTEANACDALNRGTNTVYAAGTSESFTYDAVGYQKSPKPEAEPPGDRDFEAVRTHGARSGIPRHSAMASGDTAPELQATDAKRCSSAAASAEEDATLHKEDAKRRFRRCGDSATKGQK